VIYQHSTVAATLLDMGRRLPLQPGRQDDVIPADAMVALHGVLDGPSPPLVDPSTLTAGFGADILIITIDTLRADHLGSYGNPIPLSPHLDALAAESIVFERAYTPSPFTGCALPSLLVGMPFCVLARMGKSEGHPTIADVMARSGYKSAAFVRGGYFPPYHGMVTSYDDRKFGFDQLLGEQPSDPTQTDRTLSFLAGQTSLDQKLLTWIHYTGPHEHRGTLGNVDQYREMIGLVDREVGRLIAHVRRTRPRTIIAVTSDHGEEFGEHGGTKHGHALYEESVRVPLIVYIPGTHARRIARPVSITALFSTLVLAAAGPSTDPRIIQQVGAEDAPVFATITRFKSRALADVRQTQAMVVVGNQKLICHLDRDYCQLFDLASDPGERTDVGPQHADRVRQLRDPLVEWLQLEQE
jgi:arylsulfatase A-like enzyme